MLFMLFMRCRVRSFVRKARCSQNCTGRWWPLYCECLHGKIRFMCRTLVFLNKAANMPCRSVMYRALLPSPNIDILNGKPCFNLGNNLTGK